MKAAVLSDLHLDYASKDDFESLIHFIIQAQENYELLIINGDAFDSPASTSGFSTRLIKLAETFYSFLKAGGRVIYVVGNHDIGITTFTGIYERYSFEIHYPDYELKLGKKLVYFEHGHSCDPFYRTHLYDVLKIIESETGFEIGENLVRLLEETARVLQLPQKDGFGVPKSALKIWDREAINRIKKGADIVCMGHTHEPALKRMATGIYANSGCWVNKRTFIELEEKEIRLVSFLENTVKAIKKIAL